MSLSVREAASVLSQKFLLQPGITGVSHAEHLIVYVESEEDADRVPGRLLGFPVETRVTGKIRILSLPEAKSGRTMAGATGSRSGRWRPVPGGVSIGSVKVTAGTLATAVRDASTGETLMLSNRHVFHGPEGTEVVQPGPWDGGRAPDDLVGRILRWAELRAPPDSNLVDACLARPTAPDILSAEVLDVGILSGVEEPRVGMRVAKSGRTTNYAEATVTDVNASVKVEGYPELGTLIFENQAMTEKLLDPGDSGSIIVNPSTKRAVGLGFAGSEAVSVINKITVASKLLNFTIPAQAPPPTPSRLPWWIILLAGAMGAIVIILSSRR